MLAFYQDRGLACCCVREPCRRCWNLRFQQAVAAAVVVVVVVIVVMVVLVVVVAVVAVAVVDPATWNPRIRY